MAGALKSFTFSILISPWDRSTPPWPITGTTRTPWIANSLRRSGKRISDAPPPAPRRSLVSDPETARSAPSPLRRRSHSAEIGCLSPFQEVGLPQQNWLGIDSYLSI